LNACKLTKSLLSKQSFVDTTTFNTDVFQILCQQITGVLCIYS